MADDARMKALRAMGVNGLGAGLDENGNADYGNFADTGRKIGSPGETLDSWTGAPVRKAIGAAQDGAGLWDSMVAGARQFAKDPQTAPTGEDIVKKAGIEKLEPYAAEIARPFVEPFTHGSGAAAMKSYDEAAARNKYLTKLAGLGVDAAADAGTIASMGAKGVVPLAGKVEALAKGERFAEAKKLLDSVKTSDRALALKGKKRDAYLAALDEVYGPKESRASEHFGVDLNELKKLHEQPRQYDSEGYTINAWNDDDDPYGIWKAEARDKDGWPVGEAEFTGESGRLEPNDSPSDYESKDAVKVGRDHRRKGLASGMYNAIEKESGMRVFPSGSQSRDGSALWNGKATNIFGEPRHPEAAFDPRFKDEYKVLAGGIGSVDDEGFNAANILSKIDTADKAVALKGPERDAYLKALDETYGDRAKRSKDMGFGEKEWFHGSNKDFDSFRPSTSETTKTPGSFFTDDPFVAETYVRDPYGVKSSLGDHETKLAPEGGGEGGVYVARLKNGTAATHEIDGKKWYEIEMSKMAREAKEQGLDALMMNNLADSKYGETPSNIAYVFDPKNIRASNAAFDPRFKDSDKLLAGGFGTTRAPMTPIKGQGQDNGQDDFTAMLERLSRLPSR